MPNIPANAFGQQSSAALQNFAQTAGQVVGKFRQARIQSQYSSALSSASADLKELEEEFRQRRENVDPDNPPDPDAVQEEYEERSEAIRAKHGDSITEQFAFEAFNQQFDGVKVVGGINIRREARRAFVEFAQRELDTGLSRLANLATQAQTTVEQDAYLQQGLASIQGAVATGVISAVAGAELEQGFRSQFAENVARRLLIEDPEAAEVALADSGARSPDLEESTRLVLLDQATQRAAGLRLDRDRASERLQKERESALAAENAIKGADLEIEVSRGGAGLAEIEAAAAQNIISQDTRVALIKQVDQAHKDRMKEAALADFVSAAITGGGVFLDPKNADHRKGVDLYFERFIAPRLAEMSEDRQIDTIVQFAGQAGMIPTATKGQIRGALNSQSADGKARAALLLERIRVENPGAIDDSFSDEDVVHGLFIAANINRGMTAQEAMGFADAARLRSPAEKEALKARARRENHEFANLSFVKDELDDEFFGSGPSIPDKLVVDFNELQKVFFAETGDLNTSQNAALTRIKSVWGPTEIGTDRRMMWLAPETVYGVSDDDSGWIEEQLVSEIVNTTHIDPTKRSLADRLRLEVDPTTARRRDPQTGKPAPLYFVILLNDDGLFVPLAAVGGEPMHWHPEWTKSPAFKRMAEKLRKDQETAKRVRGKIQEMRLKAKERARKFHRKVPEESAREEQ